MVGVVVFHFLQLVFELHLTLRLLVGLCHGCCLAQLNALFSIHGPHHICVSSDATWDWHAETETLHAVELGDRKTLDAEKKREDDARREVLLGGFL